MKASDEIQKAIERIRTKGWCRRAFEKGESVCMIGAFGWRYFRPVPNEWKTAGPFVRSAIGETKEDDTKVVDFNDTHTKREVLSALRKARRLAIEAGQ
jgi:predicted  nucleic acid-binding Zn-ribbon protein